MTHRAPFEDCHQCDGKGIVRADSTGDAQRRPDLYRPDQMIRCPVCGGTGIIPEPGSFEEA